ncbi:MAG: hypothetical protein ACQRW7_06845 [Caulobacterales bacterium]|uniref:hypothetical protein n=1 Tax=Glycocaulis sp. TaxID=1969725 RepID=UPI003FA078D4
MKNRLLLSTVTATAVILIACAPVPLAATTSAQDGTRITGGDIRLALNEDGNARLTGADISLSGRVGGQLDVTGADISLRDISIGSLDATGADVRLAGSVFGDAEITGADITIRGNIAGNLRVRGADLRLEGNVDGDVDGSFADARFNGQLGSLTANGADISLTDNTRVVGDVRLNAAELETDGELGGLLYANVRTAHIGGSVAGGVDIYADEGRRWRDHEDGLVEITGEVSGGTICARRVVISGSVTGPLSVRALEPVSFAGEGAAPQLEYTPRGDERCRR